MKSHTYYRTVAIFAAAVLLAVAQLTSCKKEIITEPLRFNIRIGEKTTYGSDTKSVKSGWTDGDRIFFVFDNKCPLSIEEMIILEYSSGGWIITQQPSTTPSGSGTMDAIYYGNPAANPFAYIHVGDYYSFTANDSDIGRYIWTVANDVSYNVADNTLNASVSPGLCYSPVGKQTQVCITNLTGNDWQFAISGDGSGDYTYSPSSPEYYDGKFTYKNHTYDPESHPYMSTQADGHYCYIFVHNDKIGTKQNWTITISSGTKGTWQKTFSEKSIEAHGAFRCSGPSGVTGSEAAGTLINGWTKQ